MVEDQINLCRFAILDNAIFQLSKKLFLGFLDEDEKIKIFKSRNYFFKNEERSKNFEKLPT